MTPRSSRTSRRPQGWVLGTPTRGTPWLTVLLVQGCELQPLDVCWAVCESSGSIGSMLGIFLIVHSFPDSLWPQTTALKPQTCPSGCHYPQQGPPDGASSCWVLGFAGHCHGQELGWRETLLSSGVWLPLRLGLSGNRHQAGRPAMPKVPLTIATPKDKVSRNAH